MRKSMWLLSCILILGLLSSCTPKQGNINVVSDQKQDFYKKKITLYFPAENANALVLEDREIEVTDNTLPKFIAEELLKGSKSGVKFFPVGTQILKTDLKNGLLTLDLSQEFISGNSNQPYNEALVIYSIVNSLTEMDSIKQVQFLIGGQKAETFKTFNISSPISRNQDLIGQGAPINTSGGVKKVTVTLYFPDPNKSSYEFAKETREIDVTDNAFAKAIINELIKGSKTYGKIIPEGTKLLSVKLDGQTLTTNLSKEFIDNDHLGSGYEAMMVYSIVNSLTELPTIKTIQFQIEGKVKDYGQHITMKDPFQRNLKPIGDSSDNQNTDPTQNAMTTLSKEILTALKQKDLTKLSTLAHPDKGVRFSPYSFIDTKNNIVLTSAQLKNVMTDTKKIIFGSYDGSGLPIEMTFGDYYQKFVYDKDFLNAKQVGYNKIIGKGNATNNVFTAYPGCIMVEYHFPGFDAKYEGMDWESLRVVLEKKGTTWYLVGIVHDQWTI